MICAQTIDSSGFVLNISNDFFVVAKDCDFSRTSSIGLFACFVSIHARVCI